MDWWKKKKEKKKRALERGAMLLEDIIKCCDGKSNPIKFFSADLILQATNNFSIYNLVYTFDGNWFSGKIDDDRTILIKVFTIPDLNFYRDVAISSMVSGHKNFMKLGGCCIELGHPIMFYYGGTEQYSFIDFGKIVSWKRRMKIAEDIATALAYLHTAFSTPFVYRNMAMENIIIDKDGVAKLTNFSWCISIPLGETFVKVDRFTVKSIKNTGFIDPDYRKNGIVSEKTDTYGVGMCMLLLLIGRYIGIREFCEEMIDSWMLQFIYEGRSVYEIADPKLKETGEVTVEERCSMNAFFTLARRCIGRKGDVPTMVEVAKELKKIQRSSQGNTKMIFSSSASSSS